MLCEVLTTFYINGRNKVKEDCKKTHCLKLLFHQSEQALQGLTK